jgi:hypothetical protein
MATGSTPGTGCVVLIAAVVVDELGAAVVGELGELDNSDEGLLAATLVHATNPTQASRENNRVDLTSIRRSAWGKVSFLSVSNRQVESSATRAMRMPQMPHGRHLSYTSVIKDVSSVTRNPSRALIQPLDPAGF